MEEVIVIGAGPSGLMAAIEAKRRGNMVTIFEKKDKIGKKLLATGNGRCNFTNMNMSENYYYTDNPEFIKNAFEIFGNNDLIRYFLGLGIISKDKNGYVYPYSEQAETVVDAFKNELKELNIPVKFNSDAVKIEKKKGKFTVTLENGYEKSADKVILSAGALSSLGKDESCNSFDLIQPFKPTITRLYPALTQIKAVGLNFKALQGVKSECKISVFANEEIKMMEAGEVLFTDYGISGIVSFQVSHLINELLDKNEEAIIVLDLLPGFDFEEFERTISDRLVIFNDRTVADFFTGLHNKKIVTEIIKMAGLDPNSKVSDYDGQRIKEAVFLFRELLIKPTGTNSFDQSQVTGGGLQTSELTSAFELKKCPGLFVTGEIINVDGVCGGYNLQWAFTSGYIAGNNV